MKGVNAYLCDEKKIVVIKITAMQNDICVV